MPRKTTIVLVHGAFVDGSCWASVVRILLDRGHAVLVPSVPNRSLIGDAAYIRSFVEQIDEPVLLVGHSYGGAVITVAGVAENVVGLVYVAGYALEEGESLGQLQGRFPESELASNLVYASFPSGRTEPGIDVSVRISAFYDILAEGMPPEAAQVMALSQRPLAAVAFGEAAPVAAWESRPGWGIVASNDRTINPVVERFAYSRAALLEVTEVEAPHLVMITKPDAVVAVIETALDALEASS
ncbi:alpha/beta fold hydrolase [Microbacterium sp. P01]|uniref:alpha/beta fold hydrolase n=1 Tax=unclassified Microbacterium TaxID=2609290 RepID=UPI00366C28FB